MRSKARRSATAATVASASARAASRGPRHLSSRFSCADGSTRSSVSASVGTLSPAKRGVAPRAGIEAADRVERQLADDAAAVGRALERPVVEDHHLPVRGELQVALDHADLELERACERGQRVLRALGRRAAMADAQEVGDRRRRSSGSLDAGHLTRWLADRAGGSPRVGLVRYARPPWPGKPTAGPASARAFPSAVADALGTRCIELGAPGVVLDQRDLRRGATTDGQVRGERGAAAARFTALLPARPRCAPDRGRAARISRRARARAAGGAPADAALRAVLAAEVREVLARTLSAGARRQAAADRAHRGRGPRALRAAADRRIVLLVDPARAFGTGHHPTTRGCLVALERICATDAATQRGLDVGCGTGILAVAMRALGVAEVIGVDTDPVACESTLECAAANGFGDVRVVASLGRARGRYDVVTANLFAGPAGGDGAAARGARAPGRPSGRRRPARVAGDRRRARAARGGIPRRTPRVPRHLDHAHARAPRGTRSAAARGPCARARASGARRERRSDREGPASSSPSTRPTVIARTSTPPARAICARCASTTRRRAACDRRAGPRAQRDHHRARARPRRARARRGSPGTARDPRRPRVRSRSPLGDPARMDLDRREGDRARRDRGPAVRRRAQPGAHRRAGRGSSAGGASHARACEQCGRTVEPEVRDLCALDDLLASVPVADDHLLWLLTPASAGAAADARTAPGPGAGPTPS